VWRTCGVCVLAISVVVGCTGAASDSADSSTSAVGVPPEAVTTPTTQPTSAKAVVTPTPAPSPTALATPSSAAPATPEPSPTARVVDLRAILEVPQGDRFETFGGELIRLESVWSPADTGLGGTCLSEAWLECGLEDWLIQPSRESEPGDYDGPRLDLFFGPGVRERLGRDLRHGEGPLAVVGHFGDPAALECLPENRGACRDLFVVTAIVLGD
jgi:hypothetical protein